MGRAYRYRGRRRRRVPYSVYRLIATCIALVVVAAGAAVKDGFTVFQPYTSAISQHLPTALRVSPKPASQTLTGRATVIDGDTIEIAGQRIRFNGIDAPESAQRCKDASGRAYACGRDAANALDGFLAESRPVSCRFVDWDQYGRFVGNCTRIDGRSVQQWLVENGHALDWLRYSHGAYAVQEDMARSARRGVWQGEFQKPWEWRAAQREQAAPATASPSVSLFGQSGGCNVKGNISKKGERIYHVPGQRYYDRTRISPGEGERWFCSEDEARASGWRKARQ